MESESILSEFENVIEKIEDKVDQLHLENRDLDIRVEIIEKEVEKWKNK